MTTRPERWTIRHEGREHVVEVADVGVRKELTWWVDGAQAAQRRTSDERVVLDGGDHGAVGVRLPALFGPARRVTLHEPDGDLAATAAAHAGVGGVDLDPEPGSAAARREAWIRDHPRQHAARRGLAAAAGVLVPIALLWLLRQVDLPWPDWSLPDLDVPDLPRLDLPSIPWPDLPSIPWPSWSLPDLPVWLKEAARFVGPVLLAVAVAVGEVRRRRRQDAEKAARRREHAEHGEHAERRGEEER